MLATPVGRFRVVALVEGISFLVLLLIAMPIKYVPELGGDPMPTRIVGGIHGGLYILYAIAGFQAKSARKWSAKEALRGFLASVVPFGTFVYDWVFLRSEYEKERVAQA